MACALETKRVYSMFFVLNLLFQKVSIHLRIKSRNNLHKARERCGTKETRIIPVRKNICHITEEILQFLSTNLKHFPGHRVNSSISTVTC
jgi:hypothetical protein